MHDQSERSGPFGLPEGLFAALVGGVLLLSAFFGFSAALPLSATERSAALTTFTILAFAVTLPGWSMIGDALGRTVRRDWRAFATLLAAVRTLATNPTAGLVAATAALAAIGYGWVYWRTGKVTAAAVSQMLVVWV